MPSVPGGGQSSSCTLKMPGRYIFPCPFPLLGWPPFLSSLCLVQPFSAPQSPGSMRWPLATVLPIKASRWHFKLISGCFFGLRCQSWPNLGELVRPKKGQYVQVTMASVPAPRAAWDQVNLECEWGAIAALLLPGEPLGKLSLSRPISKLKLQDLTDKNTGCSVKSDFQITSNF